MKTYLDGGSLEHISFYSKNKKISGFTTNPSLLKKSNIKNYKDFVIKCNKLTNKPISFEVTADNYDKMLEQSEWLMKYSKNCFIKIPILNTKGKYNTKIIKKLMSIDCKLNITAVFTEGHVNKILRMINNKSNTIISIFSGRIADTGKDPVKLIKYSLNKTKNLKKVKILWASVREVYNYYEAKNNKCDIITIDENILTKLKLKNKNLNQYSKETSIQFFKDGKKIKFI
jgi:transaldolase